MKDWMILIITICAILLLTVGLCCMAAHYEARAFTRVTGKDMTFTDAFWLDLRVVENVEKPNKK